MDAETTPPIILPEGFDNEKYQLAVTADTDKTVETFEALVADIEFLEILEEEESDEESESGDDPARAESPKTRCAKAIMACLQLLSQDPALRDYGQFGVDVDLDDDMARAAGNDTFENDEVWDPIDLSLDLQMLENTPFHRSDVLRLGELLHGYEKYARRIWNMVSLRLQRHDNQPNPDYHLVRAAVRASVEAQARKAVRAVFRVASRTVAPGVRMRQDQLQVLEDFAIGGLFPNQGEIELLVAFTRLRAGTIEAYFETKREEQMPILRILDRYNRSSTVQVANELFRLVDNYLADH